MRGLPSLLLVLVAVTHYGPPFLAGLYPDPDSVVRAWFYILRGIEGALLFCVVWALAPHTPTFMRYGVALTCAWGALEEAQTAICRAAIGIEKKAQVGLFEGLCDVATGWPIYMTVVSLVLVACTLSFYKDKKCQPPI